MMRIAEAQSLCVHAAADRERAVATGAEIAPFELFANALFDGITGFLSAPASQATVRRLRGVDDAAPQRLRLL